MIKRYSLSILSLSIFSLLLTACASMNPTTERNAICNELKSNIVFSGSTSIDREAEIQNAQRPLQQKTYDKNC